MPMQSTFAPPTLPELNIEPLPHKRNRKTKTYSPLPSGAVGGVERAVRWRRSVA